MVCPTLSPSSAVSSSNTPSPFASPKIAALGAPYPSSAGVALSRLVVPESAMAASMVFAPPEKSIVLNAARVPI